MIHIQNNEIIIFNGSLLVKNIDYSINFIEKCGTCSFRFDCLTKDFTYRKYKKLILGTCIFGHSYKSKI